MFSSRKRTPNDDVRANLPRLPCPCADRPTRARRHDGCLRHRRRQPHSTHKAGGAAHAAVEKSRSQVSDLIGVRASEIVFTSGATESNNLALSGLADHLLAAGRNRLAISAIEHASVIEKARAMERQGWVVDVVPVHRSGLVDMSALEAIVGAATGIVSIAWANHEIGTIQPMGEISRLVRSKGGLLHSDLAQVAGKRPVDASLLDLASISAHKLGGPSGIGALYVSRRLRPKLKPNILGGGQEGGARSGTLSAPLCVGFGAACALCDEGMAQESERVARLRDRLRARLLMMPGSLENGDAASRLPGNLNVRFDDVDGEALVLRLQEQVSLSTGSACSAKTLEPSHVLLAIGLTVPEAETAIRIGVGHGTTTDDIDEAADAIERAVAALRSTRRRA
ncbi:cysteine desulfurase family protein [Devosia aurantiaca]|uniref:Cysteine desulfurase n=1 Tax=Devosia aurantiaca TaxID=2714858 RepID=A0A6M1SU84_9HYPH|nr:cysteine desulfurase family protein [Devosia aurantiaca]NGP16531.1 cysteine desulfurase [Devosia aurantiaca]